MFDVPKSLCKPVLVTVFVYRKKCDMGDCTTCKAPAACPKGILKKATCDSSECENEKLAATVLHVVFDTYVARDLQTGEVVPPSTKTRAEYLDIVKKRRAARMVELFRALEAARKCLTDSTEKAEERRKRKEERRKRLQILLGPKRALGEGEKDDEKDDEKEDEKEKHAENEYETDADGADDERDDDDDENVDGNDDDSDDDKDDDKDDDSDDDSDEEEVDVKNKKGDDEDYEDDMDGGVEIVFEDDGSDGEGGDNRGHYNEDGDGKDDSSDYDSIFSTSSSGFYTDWDNDGDDDEWELEWEEDEDEDEEYRECSDGHEVEPDEEDKEQEVLELL